MGDLGAEKPQKERPGVRPAGLITDWVCPLPAGATHIHRAPGLSLLSTTGPGDSPTAEGGVSGDRRERGVPNGYCQHSRLKTGIALRTRTGPTGTPG